MISHYFIIHFQFPFILPYLNRVERCTKPGAIGLAMVLHDVKSADGQAASAFFLEPDSIRQSCFQGANSSFPEVSITKGPGMMAFIF